MSAGRAIPAVTSYLSDEAISFAIDVIDASKVAERLEAHLVKSTGRRRTLNHPGKSGDFRAWKGRRNVHTEEEANAGRAEAGASSLSAPISA